MSYLNHGNFNLVGNFDILKQAPIDSRAVVGTLADITVPPVFDGNVYKGMVVSVINDIEDNNGVYTLEDVDNLIWKKIGENTAGGHVDIISGICEVYGDLPAANLHTNKLYIVKQGSGGLLGFRKYPKGIYISDGTTWNLTQIQSSLTEDTLTMVNITTWSQFTGVDPTVNAGDELLYNGVRYKNKTGAYTNDNPTVDTTNWGIVGAIPHNDLSGLEYAGIGVAYGHMSASDKTKLDNIDPSGAMAINIGENHFFATSIERDDYFIAHPSEVVIGMFISVGGGFQQWDGNAWVDKTMLVKGDKGEIGVQGVKGNDGVGIVDVIDNFDNSFIIHLSDNSEKLINKIDTVSAHKVIETVDKRFLTPQDASKINNAVQRDFSKLTPTSHLSGSEYFIIDGIKRMTADVLKNELKDPYNLGYFATALELRNTYPFSELGSFAVVGETNTVWVWSDTQGDWVDSGSEGSVRSVNGETGAIIVDKDTVGLDQVPNVDCTDASNIITGTLDTDRLDMSAVQASMGYKGYFSNKAELETAYTTGVNGDYALVGTGRLLYMWQGGAWVHTSDATTSSSGLMSAEDKKKLNDLTLENNITVTVGASGDFLTLGEALNTLSKKRVSYVLNGLSVTVLLLSGYVLDEAIRVSSIDLGFIQIDSVDPVVVATVETTLFIATRGAKLPTLNVLFDKEGRAGNGIDINNLASVYVLSGAGVINAGRNNLEVYGNSRADVTGANFSGAGNIGIYCTGGSYVGALNADVTGYGVAGIRCTNGGQINAYDITAYKTGTEKLPTDIEVTQGGNISLGVSVAGVKGGLNQSAGVITNNGLIIAGGQPIPIANGGTGATTATQARSTLGVARGKDTDVIVSVGEGAGKATTGTGNTAIGRNALHENTTGVYNTSMGVDSLRKNTTGPFNTSIGVNTLYENTSGTQNTALGHNALHNTNYNNTTGIGYNARVTGDNQVQLGNSNTTTFVYGTVQNRSDARDKADIQETQLGLEFIKKLKPVDYKWNYREDYFNEESHDFSKEQKLSDKKRKRFHHGFIAQDVQEVIKEAGIDFGGFQDHGLNDGDDVLSLGYNEFIAPMVKAIQELDARIKELEQSSTISKPML